MGFQQKLDNLKFDIRLVDWNVQNKIVTKEEVQEKLKTLPDDAEKCTRLVLEDEDFSDSH